jgi:hypothetical protein
LGATRKSKLENDGQIFFGGSVRIDNLDQEAKFRRALVELFSITTADLAQQMVQSVRVLRDYGFVPESVFRELEEVTLSKRLGAAKEFTLTFPEKFRAEQEAFMRRLEMLRQRPIFKSTNRETINLYGGANEDRLRRIQVVAPSVDLLVRLREKKVTLSELHWREFEEIVARLLEEDGWLVTLQRGTKDGGLDIRAERSVPGAGPILTIWQAKHSYMGNKVGINVVRELADTANESGASKAVIVTSSFLTQGALDRIHRDRYVLGKVDRTDFLDWIHSRS